MSSIVLNIERVGNFSSSEIVDLTTEGRAKGTFGKPALNYIKKKNRERRLGRSISNDAEARATTWGTFMEEMLKVMIGEYYHFCGQTTLVHPTISNWVGSPDAMKKCALKTVGEVKCPFTMNSFCELVDPIYEGLQGIEAMNAIMDSHKDGEKFYWQTTSNACITGAIEAELIVYCPYESELKAIKHAAWKSGDPKFQWIYSAPNEQLPYIKDDGYYNNLNIVNWTVPLADRIRLEDLVTRASELLVKI